MDTTSSITFSFEQKLCDKKDDLKDSQPSSLKSCEQNNYVNCDLESTDEVSLDGCKPPLCGCNNLTSEQLLSLIQNTNDRWLEVGLSNITDKERLSILDLLDTIAIELSTRNDDPYTLLPRVLAVIANLTPSSTSATRSNGDRLSMKDHDKDTLSVARIHKNTLIVKNADDDWDQSLKYFESNDVSKGVQLLISARKSDPLNATKRNSFKVVTSLDAVIQILVKQRVKQLLKFPKLPDPVIVSLVEYIQEKKSKDKQTINNGIEKLSMDDKEESKTSEEDIWITATSPARIDISGGWSDTPPICYELGGKVVNIAIKINGEKPIGSRVRKVKFSKTTPLIQINEKTSSGTSNTIELNTIQDVMTFDQFFNPGSLVKAALVCTNIVCDSRTAPSLEDQLKDKIGSGIVIETWSNLPAGSGLGTSSILASCIIAVLWKLTGRTFTKSDLVHATLYVEQVITTGGGYQDQVSGIYGGINLSTTTRCPQNASSMTDAYNLEVKVYPIKMNNEKLNSLMSRIVLIYTGTVRLAKNILQNVIRSWYSKNKPVIDTFHELLETSDKCCQYLLSGNVDGVGSLASNYWKQKKVLVPTCEPIEVKKFFESVSSLICGGSMAGAGGGGFLFVVLKDASNRDEVIRIGKETFHESFQVFQADVDPDGIELVIGDEIKKVIE